MAASYQQLPPFSFLVRAALNSIRSVTQTGILVFAKASLARFRVPRTVIFAELSKTSIGKIQKFALRGNAKAL